MRYLFTFRTPLVVKLPTGEPIVGLVVSGEGVQEDAGEGRVRLSLDALVFDKSYKHRTLVNPLIIEVKQDQILSAQRLR
jgi:hypothetical protein